MLIKGEEDMSVGPTFCLSVCLSRYGEEVKRRKGETAKQRKTKREVRKIEYDDEKEREDKRKLKKAKI